VAIALKTLLSAVTNIKVKRNDIKMHNSYIVYGIREMDVAWTNTDET
jgi:hypothetical protein